MWTYQQNQQQFPYSTNFPQNQQQQPPYPTNFQQGYPGYPPPSQQQPYNFYQPPQDPPPQQVLMYQEDAYAEGFEFSDASVRRGFIKKVYSILTVQLLLTIGIICIFVFHDPLKLWVKRNAMVALIVGLVVTTFTMIAMSCCTSVRRTFPMNFIFLGIFTIAEGFLLGVVSSMHDPMMVLTAAGITAAVCFALTIFAFSTKWDFTAMGGMLCVALIVLVIFGIVSMFMKMKILSLIYSCAAAFLFCLYLIYDTQMIMGGKHKYSTSPEEYVFAALSLYIDIVQIFISILAILHLTSD